MVYTSFVGAAPDAVFTLARDHGATEEAIRSSGMAYTFLRDNLYLDFAEMLVGEDGVIAGTGRGRPGGHGGPGRRGAYGGGGVAWIPTAMPARPTP